jgi:hypothetical protein
MKSEKGAALPLVMIAIVLGALVIPPFLAHADSSIIGSGNYADAIYSQYACDSGAEHGIWRLTDGGLAALIFSPGKTINYLLPETVNSLTANITVCNSYQTIASENFNSGTWTSGVGWLNGWTHSGESAIVNSGTMYEGAYHLRLRSSTGIAQRSVNLAHQINIHLRGWAKVNSFEGTENATCRISSDGITWTTVRTWTDANDDNAYHQFDIDLSAYKMTSQFWISFNANMGATSDYFYVDKLEIVWLAINPVSIAADNFETGNGAGGTGWLNNWMLSGDAVITWTGTPHAGFFHLRLRTSTGIAKRAVDLDDIAMANFQFWAKVDSLEGGDIATFRVSSDNVTWTTVYTWTRTDSDNTYHFYNMDLSSYNLTSNFWVSFNSGMNSTGDYFYVDDITMQENGFGITVIAGDSVLKAVVRVYGDGYVSIVSWYYT